MTDLTAINELIKEIKEFKEELKKNGNSYYTRIATKDIALMNMIELKKQNGRIDKLETDFCTHKTAVRTTVKLILVILAIISAIGTIMRVL
jgi:hypothetical protein